MNARGVLRVVPGTRGILFSFQEKMPMRTRTRSLGLAFGWCLLVLGAGFLAGTLGGSSAAPTQQPSPPTDLPDLKDKPKPTSSTFNDCPPDGKGGDTILNRLKNREDVAEKWYPVSFETILDLPWPRSVDKKSRLGWRDAARKQVERFEGTPVAVEGYLALARLEGPEECNCKSKDKAMRDVHVWLTAEPGQNRSEAVIVEVTPRIRAKHGAWTVERLLKLAQEETHVRISGWLLLDQEHPEQLEQTRGTLWEIHPVMEIEIEKSGKWVKLDEAP
jgi:hypothetical protein